MRYFTQSHGGATQGAQEVHLNEAAPAAGDISSDAQADFGFFMPPSNEVQDYLPDGDVIIEELDRLGELMIDAAPANRNKVDVTTDSTIPPVFTYWGQFLDHELTARTDRDGAFTNIQNPHPPNDAATIEAGLKNARTPRFDLDSVYGGTPIGDQTSDDVAIIAFALRHPDPALSSKMRVGTAHPVGPLPDTLDPHRDLPRFGQARPEVRNAALRLAHSAMSTKDFEKFERTLDSRALIGDMRNDENLIVAQFHLSFLRFHNRVIDFLSENDAGWIPDYHSAKTLTQLHYQWLIVEQYLKTVCDPAVVQRVLDTRASHYFAFQREYDERNANTRLGNAIPLEFSVAAFRYGHSMVRNVYDYNSNFGRPGTGALPNAPFDEIFRFTGGGGFRGLPKLPENWVIDWSRFVGTEPHDASDGEPARVARKIDTDLAPPLGDMLNEGEDTEQPEEVRRMFKHLAKRNLRRGYNLKMPTGQALHRYLHDQGAVTSGPVTDVSGLLRGKPELQAFLQTSASQLNENTPLWFYCLAEAEAAGGNHLGELGSWMVASTFIGVLLSDPDSAISRGFAPDHSPLRMPDGSVIDSIEQWMRFALVME